MLTKRPIRFLIAGAGFFLAFAMFGLPLECHAQRDSGDFGDFDDGDFEDRDFDDGDFGGFGGGGGNRSREREDNRDPNEAINRGIDALETRDYEEAIDGFNEYLDITKVSTRDTVIQVRQDVRYRMARILFYELNDKSAAADVLRAYVDDLFASHKRAAYKMMIVCYFETEQYEKCAATVVEAIEYDENPDIIKRVGNTEEAREGEFADDEGMDEEEADLPFTPEEHIELRFKLGQSYFEIEKYRECLAPFEYVINRSKDDLQKGLSITRMIEALLGLEDYERIIGWVPVLYRSDVRYDIRVNMALLNVADELTTIGEYDSALPLYRMIVPRDELIEYQEETLKKMRIDAGLPPLLGQPLTEDEKLIFGGGEEEEEQQEERRRVISSGSISMSDEPVEDDADVDDLGFDVPIEIRTIEELVGLLKDESQIPPYENFVNLEMAILYRSVNRYWEAVRFYDVVYKADPDGDVGQRAIYDAIELLSKELEEGDDARARAFDFLGEHKKGIFPRYVAYLLTGFYQERDEWRELIKLRPYLDAFEVSYADDVRKYDSELLFMQGVSELMSQQYSNAVNDFEMVIDEYVGCDKAPDALYWAGFSYLCLDDHKKAYDCFDRYTLEYPGGSMLSQAYHQGGVALFGMDDLTNAVKRFSYVIDQFGAESVVYSDACNMRGDIYGSWGDKYLDLAVLDYTNAYLYAQREAQASYGVFAACEIFKKDSLTYGNSHIVAMVEDYLNSWGSRDPDFAKATLWLGRVKMEEQKYDEAVAYYKDAIIKYGGLLPQEGIDQIIPEMVKLSNRLSDAQRVSLKQELQQVLEETDSPTMKLRLRVALALFNGTEDQLGMDLLNELDDLSFSPPPVLDLICKAALKMQNYSKAEDILELYEKTFSESPYINSALQLRAVGLFAEGKFDEALQTVLEAQYIFGTMKEVAWSQLLWGEIRLAQGDIADARKVFLEVLGVPDWRGKPTVNAIYKLGELEESQGNLRAAYNYYQRVYFQYKGVDNRLSGQSYLAAVRCLDKLSKQPSVDYSDRQAYEGGRKQTLQQMIADRYVNIPENADLIAQAREFLSVSDVDFIQLIDSGVKTNIVVKIDASMESEEGAKIQTKDDE
ncbi:MAG: hypothetical protein JXR23_09005 [Pontiellaceae bacterium]|nr:hypothetical protein [Pontiellaceae bacterium]